MQYDKRFTALADKDLRNYWSFLSSINAKSDDCRYQLFSNCDCFSSVDCIQRKYDADGDYSECNVELKGRNVNIEQYDDCVVDLAKIQTLCRLADQSGNPSYLVALYYNSAKLAIWRIDPENEYQVIEKVTAKYGAAPEQGKQSKQVVSLPLRDASIHTFTPMA